MADPMKALVEMDARDAIDAEAIRLVLRSEVDANALKKLAKKSKDTRDLALLVVELAWKDREVRAGDARAAKLRSAAALVHARASGLTKEDVAFLRLYPDALDLLAPPDAAELRAKLPPLPPAEALAVIRRRLLHAGAPAAGLDEIEARLARGFRRATPARLLQAKLDALVDLEHRIHGFDTTALATPAGRAESERVSAIAKAARSGALSADDRRWIVTRVLEDPRYLRSLLRRGTIVGSTFHPIADLSSVQAIEEALRR